MASLNHAGVAGAHGRERAIVAKTAPSGAASMNGWMNDATTGEMRTLAPTIVQPLSPYEVIPATRNPAAVWYSAGPPESPSQAPFSSACEYRN